MIPKIIHYCWFGKKEKPGKISKCIESWRRMLPDYQIIEWNEDNFDYESIEYAKSAYRNGKFAFVSDVARLRALIEYGGIYLDTDVEVLKSFDDLLNYHCVFGMEERNYIATSFMACEPQFPLIQEFFNTYKQKIYKIESSDDITNVRMLTDIMEKRGFVRKNELQSIGDVIIYPQEFFSPYDYINCIDLRTENSYCIHYFFVTWQSGGVKVKKSDKENSR